MTLPLCRAANQVSYITTEVPECRERELERGVNDSTVDPRVN